VLDTGGKMLLQYSWKIMHMTSEIGKQRTKVKKREKGKKVWYLPVLQL